MYVKQILKSLSPALYAKLSLIYHCYIRKYAQISYAQEGEDLILLDLFINDKTLVGGGQYIDIGAHHPFRFSNTYALYKRGWSGINIDPMPGSMKLFNKFRKRDINLEIGIGVQNEQKSYYIFVERALNTFDETLAYKYAQQNELIQIKQISIKPINEILQTHSIGRIDLLTIDAEGMDLLILQSLDWEKYQPKVVLAESIVDDMLNDPLYAFMIARNYTLIAKTTRTFIFLRKDDI